MTLHPPPGFHRVLILRFGAIGEVILTSPVIGALKGAYPDLELHFATKAAFADLLRADPRVTQVHALAPGQGVLSFGRVLRSAAPDAILDLHDKLRSRLICQIVRGRRRVVWRKRSWRHTLPVRLGLRPYHAEMLVSDRFHRAAEALVRAPLPRRELCCFVSGDARRRANRLLGGRGIDPGGILIGISPGANWATKRWPVERFAEIGERASSFGYQVVLTGNARERDLGRFIAARVPAAHDLTGATDLATLGAVIDRCTVFVANDSGPMHLARALGVPTVAIFGSTDPGQFDFTGHRFLFAGTACAPCHFYGRRRCPQGHFDCMGAVETSAVWQAISGLVDTGRVSLVRG